MFYFKDLPIEKLVKKLRDLDANNLLIDFINAVERIYGSTANDADYDSVLNTILRPPISTIFPF